MKIYLSPESMKHKKEVIKMVNHEIDYNPDFSQVTYEILEADYDWIDEHDDFQATLLLCRITAITTKYK